MTTPHPAKSSKVPNFGESPKLVGSIKKSDITMIDTSSKPKSIKMSGGMMESFGGAKPQTLAQG